MSFFGLAGKSKRGGFAELMLGVEEIGSLVHPKTFFDMADKGPGLIADALNKLYIEAIFGLGKGLSPGLGLAIFSITLEQDESAVDVH